MPLIFECARVFSYVFDMCGLEISVRAGLLLESMTVYWSAHDGSDYNTSGPSEMAHSATAAGVGTQALLLCAAAVSSLPKLFQAQM